MEIIKAVMPRNVNAGRAAGILYGDLGTSKAYVLGLAFALAGYSSFWFILAVSVLTLIVGINYIKICTFFPQGGGVYSSAKSHSKTLSVVGAFFLISDYLITASLSALSAFHYLGVPHTEIWAIAAITLIGMLNLLGPKHTGSLSLWLALPTILMVILLGILSIPQLPQAFNNLHLPSGSFKDNWIIFVGIIVALSGIEAIANTTGSMKLDKGSSYKNPSVKKTSTPAIVIVMIEVCFFTAFFGLAMNALPGLEITDGNVHAPGYPNVRDSMLRYMGEVFGTTQFNAMLGYYFSLAISIVFALLLLSAVNTAIIALSSLFFVLSRDGEMPNFFQSLNRFGVPHYSTFAAFIPPIIILIIISDIAALANLYAIGFVGAITINLAATSTNFKLPLKKWERAFMGFTCIIMLLIEITLFIEKPQARGFVVAIIGFGLLLRAIVIEQKEKIPLEKTITEHKSKPLVPLTTNELDTMLVAVTGINHSLDFALEEAQTSNKALYILFLREQKIITEKDKDRLWIDDKDACEVVDYVIDKAVKIPLGFLYTITPHTTASIIDIAKQKQVKNIILGRNRNSASALLHSLRGTTIRDVSRHLPNNMRLIVIY